MEQIGITCNWKKIPKYLSLKNCDIYQILFEERNDHENLSNENLLWIKNILKKHRKECIVHISVELAVSTAQGYRLNRILKELEWANRINAKFAVLHCGTKGIRRKKYPIKESVFYDRLATIVNNSKILICLENSASIKAYGITL